MHKLLTMHRFTFHSRILLLALLAASGLFLQCRKQPSANNTTPTTYTIKLSNGVTITGATGVTVMLPDGTVVFPLPTNPGDTTVVVNPPVDTSAGRSVMFGANTNHYQPAAQQKKLQSVRYYLPIGWVFTPSGFYGQPMKQGQKQYLGVDDYLSDMKSAGVDVLLTLMQSPDWLNGHNSGGLNTNEFPPIRPGLDREKPASYAEIAGIYKAFTIRYGSKVWPAGSYRIDPAPPRWNGDGPQVYKSGLGLVKFIETGNEKDVWWKIGTPESAMYMTPKEHAAFQIAVYDSIKLADPSMTVVMAGLTNYDLKYLQEMNAACVALGRKFPADIVNVHHYSSTGNLPGVHPPTWPTNSGCAPEMDKDMATLAKIVAFAQSIGLPTWVTEYGYDTAAGSPLAPTPTAGIGNDRLQSEWNVRSALEHVRLGAVRSYVFTMADEPGAAPSLFQTSGLLRGESTGYAEKPSFGAFVDLNNQLRGFRYLGDESTAKARVMKFRHPDGRIKYAFWSPTVTGATVQTTVAGTTVSATEFVQFLNVQNHGQPYQ